MNKPVALTQADILGILQDAYSVPLGQPIFNSSEEYNKLKAIIVSAIRYTHPAKELHLSLQKEKETGELLAVTYTDDEHRIVEVLWQRPLVKELTDEEIIEQLAELEHYQWMMWANNIVATESISEKRKERWATCMIPYAELSEEMKEHDRVWARKALAILRKASEK